MKKVVSKVNTKKVNTNVKKEEVKVEEKIINLDDQKVLKKKEQNKRVWLSCEKKGHFGCMVPSRYLEREGIREKLRCPICNEILKLKEDREEENLELAANKK